MPRKTAVEAARADGARAASMRPRPDAAETSEVTMAGQDREGLQ